MNTLLVQIDRSFEQNMRVEFLMNSASANDISSILNRVVEAKTDYDKRLLAQQLGTNYRSLMYWLRGERPLPAHLLPRLCVILNNCEVLDFLESQTGRVAFKLPEPH